LSEKNVDHKYCRVLLYDQISFLTINCWLNRYENNVCRHLALAEEMARAAKMAVNGKFYWPG